MNTTSALVREIKTSDIPACAALLASLPEWFGFQEVNAGYVEALGRLPSFIAESDGRIVGFVELEPYGDRSVEILVIAVNRELHRRGIGHALVERVRTWCIDNKVPWLFVKTRGPSTPDENYAKTIKFYLAEGFDPLYESRTEWGPENAALVLIQLVEESPQ